MRIFSSELRVHSYDLAFGAKYQVVTLCYDHFITT
jgi:hypothetical protein